MGVEPPDLSTPPLAYTRGESMRFQLWDSPTSFNAIIWEDGRRWDKLNGYTDGFTPQEIADIKEGLKGGMWLCKTHGRRTDYVWKGRRSCPPECDDDLSKCECVKAD